MSDPKAPLSLPLSPEGPHRDTPKAPDPELLTVAEVAELLRVAPQTVRSWVAEGRLSAVRLGRAHRIPRAHLVARLAVVVPATRA